MKQCKINVLKINKFGSSLKLEKFHKNKLGIFGKMVDFNSRAGTVQDGYENFWYATDQGHYHKKHAMSK